MLEGPGGGLGLLRERARYLAVDNVPAAVADARRAAPAPHEGLPRLRPQLRPWLDRASGRSGAGEPGWSSRPFIDGNGRTGRALIHLVLRRRGLAPRILPPISLILATWPGDYVGGLTATRYEGVPDSDDARAGVNRWIALFASACRRAAEDAGRFEEQVRALQDAWRGRLGPVRRASAADLIGRSYQATSQAINRLEEAGILTQLTVGRRNRASAPLPPTRRGIRRRWSGSSRVPNDDTRSSESLRRVPRKRDRTGEAPPGLTRLVLLPVAELPHRSAL